jgi:PEP-CTERM motif-containing protein
MTPRSYSPLSRIAILALALPIASFATSVQAIGTVGPTICEVGTCPDPDTIASSLGVGQSSSGTFSFLYTFTNGDQYQVNGDYSNSYGNNGSQVSFLAAPASSVIYVGNNGNSSTKSAGTDVLSLVMFENFYDPSPGVWDGNACGHYFITLPNNVSATEDLSFGEASLGGPLSVGSTTFNSPGFNGVTTVCSDLTFSAAQNASDFLDSQYNITLTFGSGITPGTQVTSNTPEPATLFSFLSGLAALALGTAARKRANKN